VCVRVHVRVSMNVRARAPAWVSVSVRKVYCGKTTDWIRMPFGMLSGVG